MIDRDFSSSSISLENTMLAYLYDAHFAMADFILLEDFASAQGVTPEVADKAFQRLKRAGLARIRAKGPVIGISVPGILHAEKSEIAPLPLAKRQQEVRLAILKSLCEGKPDPRDSDPQEREVWYVTIPAKAGVSEIELQQNLPILLHYRFVQEVPGNGIAITVRGWDLLNSQHSSSSQARTQTVGTVTAEKNSIPKADKNPGDIVGEFEILQLIGKGGMGKVYRAKHRQTGSERALKFLDKLDQSSNERFVREAQIFEKLIHKNIVRFYGLMTIDGTSFIEMEFVMGMSLKSYIQANTPISIPVGIQIITQVCEALQYAHNQGILHRDISPDNILLQEGEQIVAKLSDFGIAKDLSLDTITKTGHGVMKPRYSSPEQAMGLDTDQRSDIYSLAVTFLDTLQGLPVDRNIEISHHLAEPFATLIRKAISPNRTDRHASVQEFLKELNAANDRLSQNSTPGFTSTIASRLQKRIGSVTALSQDRANATAIRLQEFCQIEITKMLNPLFLEVKKGLPDIEVSGGVMPGGSRFNNLKTYQQEIVQIANDIKIGQVDFSEGHHFVEAFIAAKNIPRFSFVLSFQGVRDKTDEAGSIIALCFLKIHHAPDNTVVLHGSWDHKVREDGIHVWRCQNEEIILVTDAPFRFTGTDVLETLQKPCGDWISKCFGNAVREWENTV